MLEQGALKDLLHTPGRSNFDRVLLCLAVTADKPSKLQEIREIALAAGWARAKSTNLSDYLGRAKGLAIRTPERWQLTGDGKKHIKQILPGSIGVTPPPQMATTLREYLVKMTKSDIQAFVEEAVKCYEAKLYRSAVVLSWVGAIAVLYDYVVAHKLIDFNAEAVKRDMKWKSATNADGLARMKEHDFIQVLAAIGVLGKNVKDELEGCLKLRNGCGHPNSLKLAENRVAAHIEMLMLNVFDKF